jgi:ZIP family zinc transporter
VIEALLYGLLASAPLIVGGAIALRWAVPPRTLGLIMAFGGGVLIAAVAYELALEAFTTAPWRGAPAIGFFTGVATFFVGDLFIDRMGGERRKSMSGAGATAAGGTGLAIVLGTVLDGVPESAVIGMTLLEGQVSAAVFVAVVLSNLPESIAATTGLARDGRSPRWIMGLWTLVTAIGGLAALAGYVLLDGASGNVTAFVLAFAGGAILTMLADTMMPEAFEKGGRLAGVLTSVGFAVAFLITTLE